MTGIVSYGVSIPKRRLRTEEIAEVWKNNEADSLKSAFQAEERVVLHMDEDTVTMAVEAAKNAFASCDEKASEVGAIYLGTCTNPYDAKPSSTLVASALGMGSSALAADLQFSTKSGTAAMQTACALVDAGMVDSALAIGSDAMNRHMEPGNLSEPFAGAGAGAVLVGNDDVVAEVEGFASYNTNLCDDYRQEGERYLKTGMILGSHKNDIGIYEHVTEATKALLAKMGRSIGDYNYVVLQQPYGSAAKKVAKRIGATEDQISASLYASTTGDTGSSSVLIGLAKVLDQAKPGDSILVVSYGFGAGSDAISLKATDRIADFHSKRPAERILADRFYVNYAEAMKVEYKYLRSDYQQHTYL